MFIWSDLGKEVTFLSFVWAFGVWVGEDPLQGDFPEVIEEYLQHGNMKCIAFNRRGTLLAGNSLVRSLFSFPSCSTLSSSPSELKVDGRNTF